MAFYLIFLLLRQTVLEYTYREAIGLPSDISDTKPFSICNCGGSLPGSQVGPGPALVRKLYQGKEFRYCRKIKLVSN